MGIMFMQEDIVDMTGFVPKQTTWGTFAVGLRDLFFGVFWAFYSSPPIKCTQTMPTKPRKSTGKRPAAAAPPQELQQPQQPSLEPQEIALQLQTPQERPKKRQRRLAKPLPATAAAAPQSPQNHEQTRPSTSTALVPSTSTSTALVLATTRTDTQQISRQNRTPLPPSSSLRREQPGSSSSPLVSQRPYGYGVPPRRTRALTGLTPVVFSGLRIPILDQGIPLLDMTPEQTNEVRRQMANAILQRLLDTPPTQLKALATYKKNM